MFAVKLLRNQQHLLEIPEGIEVHHGDRAVVMTDRGEEAAIVYLIPDKTADIFIQKKVPAVPLIRVMTAEDLKEYEAIKLMNDEGFKACADLIKQHNLQMNLVLCSYTFDKKKVTFYYTAPERIDFRNLLKDLTKIFKKVRIDLKHIGVRDETAICCGNGLCGRPFCCCTFKRRFDSINIKLAHEQGMPITPGKVSGTCGRLLCCLNYEYQNYLDTAKKMPPAGAGVITANGAGRVFSLNILTGKISVKFPDGKIKEFACDEVEMLNTDVNVDIESDRRNYKYALMQQEDGAGANLSPDDKNSNAGDL